MCCWSSLTIFVAISSEPRRASAEPPSPIATRQAGRDMVLVPAGGFTMGSLQGSGEETPPHQRFLPAYYMDRTEVTVGQYAQFVSATGHAPPAGWQAGPPATGSADLPITNITWSDAMHYARWAGKRLPTEAEWEKAARGADGRLFPWGHADREDARNKDSGKLLDVGRFPDGVSPHGCLDMSGNAWEWTADWFDAYRGTATRDVHFGRGYKVVRGGGGEYLYGTDNRGTVTQRARLVPYGAHDFVGFRCVQHLPGQPSPYDPDTLLREAAAPWQGTLDHSRALVHEQQCSALDAAARIPLRVTGSAEDRDLVVSGLPLPRGRVRSASDVELRDTDDRAIPSCNTTLATWPDGSLRWLLLRFPAQGGDAVTAHLGPSDAVASSRQAEPGDPAIRLTTHDQRLTLDTGVMIVSLARDGLIEALRVGEQTLGTGTVLELDMQDDGARQRYGAGTAQSFQVVSHSVLHVDVRWQGPLVDTDGAPSPFTYDLRLRAVAGSRRLRLWLTLLHAQPRQLPWDALQPQCQVVDWRFGVRLQQAVQEVSFGTERDPVRCPSGTHATLQQHDDLHYDVTANQQQIAQGTRAPGWVAGNLDSGCVTLGVRHFWQNHSQTLFLDDQVLGVRFWSGSEPFRWEGGLAKTHELVLEVGDTRPMRCAVTPLRAVPPPAWMCGTQAAGALLPRNDQALAQLAYWECWRETAMRQWATGMPTGLRDFGDAFLGGPYKGRHAYANLEYDVAMNFLHQFLRTGDAWYLETAESMARHQAHIDTENVAGFAWKHSPLHTTEQAEFGHVFLRGLILHHLLTGDVRSLEAATKIGDWIADSLLHGRGVGNERQIGWSLYALTALDDVAGKPEYKQAAQALTKRLIDEQAPTGRFNIRWDNRIAFFNGIAMNGLLSVNDAAPDERLQEGVLRVAVRTLGMYPDYACRTLNAYCWALEHTGDARFLDNMQQSWLTSLAFLMDRDTTTCETHAWRFPPFAVRYNLFPQVRAEDATLPHADNWRAVRLKQSNVELYLRPIGRQTAPLLLVREGLARGAAELSDAGGETVTRTDFAASGQLLETHSLAVSGTSPWYRLRLSSEDAFGWQIHSDHRAQLVVVDRTHRLPPDMVPRAYGALEPAATEVSIRLTAEGEGFHSATLFDPAGVPVTRVQRFIEFEDPGRYELHLTATVSGARDGWSLEMHRVQIASLLGMVPYWSTSADAFFHPDHAVESEGHPRNTHGETQARIRATWTSSAGSPTTGPTPASHPCWRKKAIAATGDRRTRCGCSLPKQATRDPPHWRGRPSRSCSSVRNARRTAA